MVDLIIGILIGLPLGGLIMHGLHEYIDSLLDEDEADEKLWLGRKK